MLDVHAKDDWTRLLSAQFDEYHVPYFIDQRLPSGKYDSQYFARSGLMSEETIGTWPPTKVEVDHKCSTGKKNKCQPPLVIDFQYTTMPNLSKVPMPWEPAD
jgi:hypothetical protein